MRMLAIDATAKERAADIVKYAEENPYIIGKDSKPIDNEIPGHNVRRQMEIKDGYRCVFTFTTRHDGKVFRHLTVSVHPSRKGVYPRPEAVWLIAADLFGFTGYDTNTLAMQPPSDWQFAPVPDDNCIAVVQEKSPDASPVRGT